MESKSVKRKWAAVAMASVVVAAASCDLWQITPEPEVPDIVETIEEVVARAYGIEDVRDSVGRKDLWVRGYIVGGDLTAKNASFEPPFSAVSNIVIGPSAHCCTRDSCMSVSLPQNSIRNELNLVTNPGNLGKEIYIKGEIVLSYFGLRGIKPATDYRLAPSDASPEAE